MDATRRPWLPCEQARALAKRRALQRQVLYTQPGLPRVGQRVAVFYNPDATVLRCGRISLSFELQGLW